MMVRVGASDARPTKLWTVSSVELEANHAAFVAAGITVAIKPSYNEVTLESAYTGESMDRSKVPRIATIIAAANGIAFL